MSSQKSLNSEFRDHTQTQLTPISFSKAKKQAEEDKKLRLKLKEIRIIRRSSIALVSRISKGENSIGE